jgi:transposase-like protein
MTVKKHSINAIDLKALVPEDCDGMKSLTKAAIQEVLEAEMTEFLRVCPHEGRLCRPEGLRQRHGLRLVVGGILSTNLTFPKDLPTVG